MARKQQTIITFTDDFDGREIAKEDAVLVKLSYAGKSYELDLSQDNARKLDDAIAPFLKNVSPIGGRSASSKVSRTGKRHNLDAVRSWARANGHTVSDRGRVAQSILDEYEAANR